MLPVFNLVNFLIILKSSDNSAADTYEIVIIITPSANHFNYTIPQCIDITK